MKSNDKKQKIIQKAKRINFRQEINKATETPQGLWRLAKWAKDKSHQSREVSKMPMLKFNDQVADTFDQKAEMLKDVFFPALPPADLSDIEASFYPISPHCPIIITKSEVSTALSRLKSDKAPGPDGISNRILKACSEILVELLTPLFQACVTHLYHPRAFKMANTIALKKIGKGDYTTPKAYRPIALLNTLSKVMESIIGSKITYLAEKHRLLPDTQMGARKGRSTESALELLTKQVHTIWGQGKDKVATLLSMDVAGAFDTVSHQRLTHNLRKRKILKWITDWLNSFLSDRSTTLAINRKVTGRFAVRTGIPQGSPLSSILYLFYNADLLEICDRPGKNTSAIGFVDDANILAYGKSTEENCKTLEAIHRQCETWASRHGSVFAPTKYELIHLSRNPKRFNMTASINIASTEIEPKTDIRVLGLQIDTKLKWGPHVRKTQEKMVKQSMALTKISTSTWGATFAKARQVYSAVVRPAMTYGSTVWHMPKEVKKSKTSTSKLSVMQNNCLRTIAGAFKATPISVLEAETFIAPIDTHLDMLQAQARHRLRAGGQLKIISSACNKIADKLRGKAGRKRLQKPTPGELKHIWAKSLLIDSKIVQPPKAHPPLFEVYPAWHREATVAATARHKQMQTIKSRQMKVWNDSWCAYQNRVIEPSIAQSVPLSKKRLKIHTQLKKAESALTTQIRTGKLGLADFLYKRRVPSVTSPVCSSGWHRQTPEHVIMICRLIDNREQMFRAAGTSDYQQLTKSSKTLKILTAWLMKTGLLNQFSLTSTLL